MTYNGSEYLFQADDQPAMVSWIGVIRKNSNPDSDVRIYVLFNNSDALNQHLFISCVICFKLIVCKCLLQEMGVASEELILRKTSEAEQTFKLGSPQGPPKPIKTLPSTKKVSVRSLKMKTPATHSPGTKPRKASEKGKIF